MPRIQGAAAGMSKRHSPITAEDETTGRTTRRSHMQTRMNLKGNSQSQSQSAGGNKDDKGVSIAGAAATDRDVLRSFSDEEDTNTIRQGRRKHDYVATHAPGTQSFEPCPKKIKSESGYENENERSAVDMDATISTSDSVTPDKIYSKNATIETTPKETKNDEELMMEALMKLKRGTVSAEDLPPLSLPLTSPKRATNASTATTKQKRKYTKRSKKAKSATVTPRKNSNSDAISTEGIQPTELDVLLGRGKRSNLHAGNKRFRRLVESQKPVYFRKENKRNGKNRISIQVMKAVHAWGGRFLRQVPGKHPIVYEEVDEKVARKKCSQRLREGEVNQNNYNHIINNRHDVEEDEEEEGGEIGHVEQDDDDEDDDNEDDVSRSNGVKGVRGNIGEIEAL